MSPPPSRQLEVELRKVREERDRLATELTHSQTQLTSLQSTHLPQLALERFVRGEKMKGR